MSKQVRALEDELGQRVVERGRHVRSTPGGEVLLQYADQICDARERAATWPSARRRPSPAICCRA